jgi:hypothetical protein
MTGVTQQIAEKGLEGIDHKVHLILEKCRRGIPLSAHDVSITLTEMKDRLKYVTETLRTIAQHGDFSNGVTDPTNSIDQGTVSANKFINDGLYAGDLKRAFKLPKVL